MRKPAWVTLVAALALAAVLAMAVVLALAGTARAEAEAHYGVELKLSPRHDALDAATVIDLPAGQARGEQVFILADRFHIRSAEAGPGVKVTVEPTNQPFPHLQQVRVAFAADNPAPGHIRIAYDGPLDGGVGFDKISQDGFLEFRIDAFWLPTRSDIGLRYTADTHVMGLPSGMEVAAQGQVRQQGGQAWMHREAADIDLAFVVIGGLKAVSAPGVDFHAADLDSPLVKTFRRHAEAAAAFHQAMLGPMPGGPMQVVVVPRTSGSDYQRAGYILLSHRRYPGELTPRQDEIRRAHHIAHELAHAWWSVGSPVTEDDWLNESFADYSGLRYVEQAFDVAARQSVLDEARADAEKAGPVIGAGRPSQQALYAKGPILLFDLDARIGREKMDRLMGRIGRDRPRHTAEFLKALADIACPDVAADFERRLRARELILG
jgi:hypothetical protein